MATKSEGNQACKVGLEKEIVELNRVIVKLKRSRNSFKKKSKSSAHREAILVREKNELKAQVRDVTKQMDQFLQEKEKIG